MEFTKAKTLGELFAEWKKAQLGESDESCDDTFPVFPKKWVKRTKSGEIIEVSEEFDRFKGSWADDGYICESRYNEAKKKVLFILKERANSNLRILEEVFWFQNVVIRELNGAQLHGAERKYYYKIKALLDAICATEKCSISMDQIAYMNINKRGGLPRGTVNKRLRKYADVYKNYILNEIEILAPDIIVFCGAYDIFKKNLLIDTTDHHSKTIPFHNKKCQYRHCKMNIGNNTADIFYMYHPACRNLSDDEYGAYFIEVLNRAKTTKKEAAQ